MAQTYHHLQTLPGLLKRKAGYFLQRGSAPTSSLGPQRHHFGVISKAGGMEKLLLLALSLVHRATLQLDTVMSLSIWAVQVHLTTDRISPSMGQEFRLCKHLLGKKERPRAVWRGSAMPFFI